MKTESTRPLCQQILRVERRSWQPTFECEKPAHFTWVSDLRGKVKLCRQHAKRVGLENCKPIAAIRGSKE